MSHCPAGDPPVYPERRDGCTCDPARQLWCCDWCVERLRPCQCVCAEISAYNAALIAGTADEGDGYFEPPSEDLE
jgi:hypothetical protein